MAENLERNKALAPPLAVRRYARAAPTRPVPTMASLHAYLTPIALLLVSNIFMTFAWYGHLKYKAAPLLLVVLASWLIALPEYLLAVPANRLGHSVYSAVQLKTIQEVITLVVFIAFSVLYLGEALRWNHVAGFATIAFGAWLVFR